MKAVKIILATITLLILVFFLTGLFINETKYTSEILVEKPLEEVFAVFNDNTKIKNWIPELKSLKPIITTPEIAGSTYEMVVNNQGQEITMTEKVLEYIPNKKVVIFFDAENMLKTDSYIFSLEDKKTKITMQSSCKSDSYLMSCLFPYFKGTFKEIDQGYLNNFKTFIEKI